MLDIKYYPLDFETTYDYFMDTIGKVNTLSRALPKHCDLQRGSFFTFFPDNQNSQEHIKQFKRGGIQSRTREFVYSYIYEKVKNNLSLTVVLDDFEADYNPSYDEELFNSHGKFLKKEIYYFFNSQNASIESMTTAFRYSDVLWHSLIIISKINTTDDHNKEITNLDCANICKNAELILTTAYDGEGYIFWKKKQEKK